MRTTDKIYYIDYQYSINLNRNKHWYDKNAYAKGGNRFFCIHIWLWTNPVNRKNSYPTSKTMLQSAKPEQTFASIYVSVKLFYRPVVLYFAFLSSIWFQTLNYVLFVSFVGGIEFFFHKHNCHGNRFTSFNDIDECICYWQHYNLIKFNKSNCTSQYRWELLLKLSLTYLFTDHSPIFL